MDTPQLVMYALTLGAVINRLRVDFALFVVMRMKDVGITVNKMISASSAYRLPVLTNSLSPVQEQLEVPACFPPPSV